MRIEGGCYCGEIRYVSVGDAQASVQCHCRQCQYITGGHPNVLMIMPLDGFKFISGKPQEYKRNDIENAVTALKQGDAAGFRDATSQALYHRVADVLAGKKIEIAQNIFSGEQEPDTEKLEDTQDADSTTDS